MQVGGKEMFQRSGKTILKGFKIKEVLKKEEVKTKHLSSPKSPFSAFGNPADSQPAHFGIFSLEGASAERSS